MNQTRAGSLIEAAFNTAIGLGISFAANALVFPAFGFHPSIGENVAISCIYTGISLVRQYVIRRWFNARLHAAAQRLAGVRRPPELPKKLRAAIGLCAGCLATVRLLKRGEVALRCKTCGKRWMNAAYTRAIHGVE